MWLCKRNNQWAALQAETSSSMQTTSMLETSTCSSECLKSQCASCLFTANDSFQALGGSNVQIITDYI